MIQEQNQEYLPCESESRVSSERLRRLESYVPMFQGVQEEPLAEEA